MLKSKNTIDGKCSASPHSLGLDELLVRPKRVSSESERGYRLRLAHRNGLDNPAWLDSALKFIRNNESAGHIRWCPSCLIDENANWNSSWERGAPVCAKHLCWLSDYCAGCNKILSLRQVRFRSCHIGHTLVNCSSENLPESIRQLLSSMEISKNSHWWQNIAIERRLAIAHFLGALHIYGLLAKPLKKASQAPIAFEKSILTAGSIILLGGEVEFCNLLQRIRVSQASQISYQLFREVFPGLLQKMRRQLLNQEYEMLTNYIRAYLNAPVNNNASIIWRGNHNNKIRSAVNCAKDLNVRLDRVKKILCDHGFAPNVRKSASGREMSFITSNAIQQVQEAMLATAAPKSISKIFGISPARQKQLVSASFIRTVGKKIDTK